jgi:hypothetical protein
MALPVLSRAYGTSLARGLIWFLVIVVCVARIVPFSPDLPSIGLDASWRFGLEQALSQGLVPGRDLLFTFGPYSSVYTRSYHPATDTLMLLASTYLALSYAAVLGLLMVGSYRRILLAWLIIIAGLVYVPDSLLFSFPLLLALLVFAWHRQPGAAADVRQGASPLAMFCLFMPLGLLPLVKGTLLLICVLLAVLCAAYLYAQRFRAQALACIAGPLVSLPLFWMASGQPISALPDYVIGMFAVVAGYTEAMAYPGVVRESILFVLAALVLLLAIYRLPALHRHARIFLLLVYAAFLFMAFKAGFVRQDGHAVIATTALLMALASVWLLAVTRMVLCAAVLVLLAWQVTDHHYHRTTPYSLAQHIGTMFSTAWSGAGMRLREPHWPQSQSDANVASMRQQAVLPLVSGSSDIYSYNQSFLIASGNQWQPRPVLQSYSAYTPFLAEANRAHLLGKHAPDHIFFAVETIDERYPSLDDGASWPVLLTHYVPRGTYGNTLLLERHPVLAPSSRIAAIDAEYRFGDEVPVPAGNKRQFVQMDIQLNWLGRCVAFLFRPSQLAITVTLANGEHRQFRMVSGMAKAGFLLSPLVENTEEFAALYNVGPENSKRVVSFRIDTADKSMAWLWQKAYRVSYTAG